LTKTEI